MYTVTDLLNEIYTETGLDSSSKASILSRLNDYQRQLCGMDDWTWLEDSFDITTVVDSNIYSLPIDVLKVKTIYPTVAGRKYQPLQEIVSPIEFDSITNGGQSYKSDYPQVYHVREGNLYIWPYSSTATTTVTVWYLKRPIPMATEDYSTGSIAVKVADAMNKKLLVAGQGALEWNRAKGYLRGKDFEVTSPNIEYIGFVDKVKRKKLLSDAECVLVPSLYAEPFGGVNVEAQLSGTPVLTTAFGAFQETVKHGETGFICYSNDEFIENAKKVKDLDPKVIRKHAERYLMDNMKYEYQAWFDSLYSLYF